MVLVSGFLNVLDVLVTVLVSAVSCETPIVVDETSPTVDCSTVLCASLLPTVELSSSRVAGWGAELVIIRVVDTGFIVVMADVVAEISVDELTSSSVLELPLSTIAEVWVSSAPPTLIVVASVTREIVSIVVCSVTDIESPPVEICSPVEDESVLVKTCSVLENNSVLVEVGCSVLEDGSVLVKTGSVVEGVSGAPVVTAGVEFSVSSGNLGVCVLS